MSDITKKTNLIPTVKIQKLMELEVQYKEIKKQIDEYKADLLKVTQDLDVLTLKTGKYTISRAKRITPRVVSFKVLKDSLDKADIPYETEEAFTPQMSVLFRELAKQERELDGLEVLETEYVSIRVREEE